MHSDTNYVDPIEYMCRYRLQKVSHMISMIIMWKNTAHFVSLVNKLFEFIIFKCRSNKKTQSSIVYYFQCIPIMVYHVHTCLSVVPNELMFLVYNFVPHNYIL